jgi:hypothetical protein
MNLTQYIAIRSILIMKLSQTEINCPPTGINILVDKGAELEEKLF